MWPCASRLQLTPNDQNNKDVKVEVSPVRALIVDVWHRTAEGFCEKFEKYLSLKNVRNVKNDGSHRILIDPCEEKNIQVKLRHTYIVRYLGLGLSLRYGKDGNSAPGDRCQEIDLLTFSCIY